MKPPAEITRVVEPIRGNNGWLDSEVVPIYGLQIRAIELTYPDHYLNAVRERML